LRSFFTRPGDIYLDLSISQAKTIKGADGLFGCAPISHFDKGKSFRIPGIPVFDQLDGGYFAGLAKQGAEIVFGCAVRKVSNIQFLFHLWQAPEVYLPDTEGKKPPSL
jgi:hypothetical protein